MKNKFQAISVWLYKGCWMKVITAEHSDMITEKANNYSALAICNVISKFIEYVFKF